MARCLDRLSLKEPLEEWSNETVEKVVNTFVDEKFPTVYALNKIDHPDADKVFVFDPLGCYLVRRLADYLPEYK